MPYEDDLLSGKAATKNLSFDENGNLFQTKIDLSTTAKAQKKPLNNIFIEREEQIL